MSGRTKGISWNSSSDAAIQEAARHVMEEHARMAGLERRLAQQGLTGPLALDEERAVREELEAIRAHRRDLAWVKARLEARDRRYGTIFEMRYMGESLWESVYDCLSLSKTTVLALNRDMLDVLRGDPDAVAVMNGDLRPEGRDAL